MDRSCQGNRVKVNIGIRPGKDGPDASQPHAQIFRIILLQPSWDVWEKRKALLFLRYEQTLGDLSGMGQALHEDHFSGQHLHHGRVESDDF